MSILTVKDLKEALSKHEDSDLVLVYDAETGLGKFDPVELSTAEVYYSEDLRCYMEDQGSPFTKDKPKFSAVVL